MQQIACLFLFPFFPGTRGSRLTIIGMLFVWCAGAQIQSLSPVLIGSAGGYATTGTLSLSFSVGEPVIQTEQSATLNLTQGFQQPSVVAVHLLNFNLIKTDASCAGMNDGTASVNIASGNPPYTVVWSTNPPSGAQTVSGLAPGIYICSVRDASGNSAWDTVQVGAGNGLCGIHVYTGFSPNGDNKNDTWIIDNIETYSSNTVSVYNRWGDRVWTTTNYNNSNNVWSGTDAQRTDVPDGTYYYVIEAGGKIQKGWVEVSR
ncbi:MAG TPA: gliding motility-associated C-terminal domain-containing protein [Bacteroidia bacterium]|nr:gliding motility-associated C-terminal domain-containing protein [Bacteroidia bacterium]